MTNAQLYLAIGMPSLAVIVGLVINFFLFFNQKDDIKDIKTDIKEMRVDLKNLMREVYLMQGKTKEANKIS